MIKPLAAALLILLTLLAFPAGQSFAQGRQSGPIAAPVGPAAQSQDLAAPPGTINAAGPAGDVGGSFSIVSMFMRADIVVKAVMVLLLLASLWSWTIIFNKLIIMSTLKRKARRFEGLLVRPVAGRALSADRRPQRPSHGRHVHRRPARMASRF